ncbi:MAG TPA: hypothetical protein VFS00_17450 [Polyangiaceae bacterium]|nr:hypothetical protein [Polyangiaceae bacterium]
MTTQTTKAKKLSTQAQAARLIRAKGNVRTREKQGELAEATATAAVAEATRADGAATATVAEVTRADGAATAPAGEATRAEGAATATVVEATSVPPSMDAGEASPIDRWAPEAQKLPSDAMRLTVPFHVHLGEAVDVARFHRKYYAGVAASDGRPGRPGLESVADEGRGLNAATGDDLLSLREATQQAHVRYLLKAAPASATPLERARYLVGEIAATVGYLFDDGVDDERDAQLAAVQAAHADAPASTDAVAAELEDYVGLGESYRSKIEGLGGFEGKLLDEAKAVAAELRERPATPAGLSDEAARALALRNRLAMLLAAKMGVVRSAARFVFRHHPAVVREATSAYERRRRAAARRGALPKGPALEG